VKAVDDLKIRTSKKTEKAKEADVSKSSERAQINKPKKSYNQIIFRDWCKACGMCSAFCPKKVIGRDKTGAPVIEHPEDCIGCRFCEIHCPDFAITIKERIVEPKRYPS
jgi:2-oxoglutarate ferredoxin oxidoreductase subunit delta